MQKARFKIETIDINVRELPKGQSKMDSQERLATKGTQDEEKNHITICVGHHYKQTNTNNVNKT